jgi:hypothetical protein
MKFISEVKRFQTQILFLTNEDKKGDFFLNRLIDTI